MNAMTEIAAPVAVEPATIRANAGDLRRAVAQASTVVHRRNTIPVLGCLLVKPGKDKLEITGTDLDSLLTIDCPAECGKKAQAFVIQADLLKRLLAGAEAGETVEIGRDGDVLTFKIGPATAHLRQLQPVEDFPAMAEAKTAATAMQVKASALVKILTNCAPCISTEETRYYLNGIYFHAREGMLAGVSTDGHRLSLYQTDIAWPVDGQIVPRTAAAVLAQLMGKAGDAEVEVTSWADTTRLHIAGQGWSITFKTIDGTFPDYTRVIPKRSPDAGYLVLSPATLRRVPQIFERSYPAALDLPNATLAVRDRSQGLDFVLPIEAKGAFTVGFNANYLRTFTHAFGTIRLEVTSPGDAATVLSQDPNWLGVIMPMRV
ncbi:DNA polymerase III subunit beta [Paracoccus sp. SY]|uniref:DNA polymerase III subunit beta n=1 Tax=Paracoccus sp. SY TaxID=1330255 RepID=UPI000CD20EFA|nr:DNA polymerase III subunit beta [Paracoccus sp. SY]